MHLRTRFLPVFSLAACAVTAYAETVTDEQTFRDGLLPSYYEEDLAGFSSGDEEVPPLVFDNSTEFSFEATSVSSDGQIVPSDNLFFAEGSGYTGTAMSLVENTDSLRFTTFSGSETEVTGVGGRFFLTDSNGDLMEGAFTVTATLSDDSTLAETVQSPALGGELPFVGFFADEGLTITAVDIVTETQSSFVTTGSVIVGTQVPEPATVVLWSGLGVFATVFFLRRRQRTGGTHG